MWNVKFQFAGGMSSFSLPCGMSSFSLWNLPPCHSELYLTWGVKQEADMQLDSAAKCYLAANQPTKAGTAFPSRNKFECSEGISIVDPPIPPLLGRQYWKMGPKNQRGYCGRRSKEGRYWGG